MGVTYKVEILQVMRERMKLEKEEGKGKDVFDMEPSISSVDALKDPTGTRTGKQATHEPLETQQELSEGAARTRPQVERLSQRQKKLNVISSVLNPRKRSYCYGNYISDGDYAQEQSFDNEQIQKKLRREKNEVTHSSRSVYKPVFMASKLLEKIPEIEDKLDVHENVEKHSQE
ncbi:hypothetical protein HAX54_012607 [Datura stramonium]|uniref:Uncharacterized protein n=1 Tax=Datura stramonium TaxID=4076 RepID=A0ABS8TKY6_DATST|nr:hypothetical protein [Datura stramonium]